MQQPAWALQELGQHVDGCLSIHLLVIRHHETSLRVVPGNAMALIVHDDQTTKAMADESDRPVLRSASPSRHSRTLTARSCRGIAVPSQFVGGA